MTRSTLYALDLTHNGARGQNKVSSTLISRITSFRNKVGKKSTLPKFSSQTWPVVCPLPFTSHKFFRTKLCRFFAAVWEKSGARDISPSLAAPDYVITHFVWVRLIAASGNFPLAGALCDSILWALNCGCYIKSDNPLRRFLYIV